MFAFSRHTVREVPAVLWVPESKPRMLYSNWLGTVWREKAWIAGCLWQLFFFLNVVFCHLPSILCNIADCCLLLYSAFRIFATSKWLIKKICLCRKWSVTLSTVSIAWVVVIFFPIIDSSAKSFFLGRPLCCQLCQIVWDYVLQFCDRNWYSLGSCDHCNKK